MKNCFLGHVVQCSWDFLIEYDNLVSAGNMNIAEESVEIFTFAQHLHKVKMFYFLLSSEVFDVREKWYLYSYQNLLKILMFSFQKWRFMWFLVTPEVKCLLSLWINASIQNFESLSQFLLENVSMKVIHGSLCICLYDPLEVFINFWDDACMTEWNSGVLIVS